MSDGLGDLNAMYGAFTQIALTISHIYKALVADGVPDEYAVGMSMEIFNDQLKRSAEMVQT